MKGEQTHKKQKHKIYKVKRPLKTLKVGIYEKRNHY